MPVYKNSASYLKTATNIVNIRDSVAPVVGQSLVTSSATSASWLDSSSNSLYRQALINGNFDVWQRGTSSTGTTPYYSGADRWQGFRGSAVAGGTWSQQAVVTSELAGSKYCMRIQRDASNSATNVLHLTYALESVDSIKFIGKKLTLSFWARKGANYSATSDLLTARILSQTGAESNFALVGASVEINNDVTLTTSWQKFTATTTNVIGTTVTQLGVDIFETPTGTAGANDYFEITQVQLCAGDVALPFMPKSFEEELRACQRYYQKTFPYATTPAQAVGNYTGAVMIPVQVAGASKYSNTWVSFPTRMRIAPAITFYNPISSNTNFYNRAASADSGAGATTYSEQYENGIGLNNVQVAGDAVGQVCYIHYTVSAEL